MSKRTLITSYRQAFTTGAVTTIAAETASAGHLLALRNKTEKRNLLVVLRALEVEFVLTTAFGSAQEVGFSAYLLRNYTAPHTDGTALSFTTGCGVRVGGLPTSKLTGRIANTAALTAGTQTLDTNPIARGSAYCDAVGAMLTTRRYDFGPEGFELGNEEGLLITNLILMGASGVGKWHFTIEADEYKLG